MDGLGSAIMAYVGRLPLGVAILAILIGVFGLFVFILGFVLAASGLGGDLGASSSVFGVTGILAIFTLLVVGAIMLAVAFGLWHQEFWALVLAIIVLLFYGVIEFVASAWVAFAIVVVLLVYLIAVSQHFD